MNETNTLEAYFAAAEGSEIQIEESFRFLVHDPNSILFIQEGSLDLFALNVQGDLLFTNKGQLDDLGMNNTPFLAELLEGTLIYLGSLTQGDLLFQFPLCSGLESLRIIAIALTPLKLKKTSFRLFQNALKENPPLIQAVSHQVIEWIAIFDRLLNPGINGSAPSSPIPINLHSTLHLASGSTLCHTKTGTQKQKNRIIWVQAQQGALGIELPSTKDKEYYQVKAGAPPFPITQNIVLHCLEDSQVTSFSLEDLLKGSLFIWSILCFHQAALQWLTAAVHKKALADTSSFKQRAFLDQESLKNALKEASQILEIPENILLSESQDPLLRACELIGEKQGIKFMQPHHPSPSTQWEDRLAALCSFSHVNFRKVFLEDMWWERTEGYILCFNKANKPVVVHCNIGRHSSIVDPDTLLKTPLNKTAAKGLKNIGYMFYRNFPEKPSLSMRDLIRFVFFKRGREIRAIILCGFLAVLVALFIPFATNIIFDQVIPTLDSSLLLQIGAAMVISVVSTALFQLTKEYTINRLLSVVDIQLMAAIWDRVLNLKASFFRKYETGDLYLRIQGISDMAQQIVGNPLRILLNAIFSLLYLASMLYYSPGLTLVGVTVIGGMALITSLFIIKNFAIQKEIMDIKGFTSSKVIEIIQAITKVRTSGLEKRVFSYWLRNFNRAKNLEKIQLANNNIVGALLNFAPNLAYFLILSVIIYSLSQQSADLKPYISVGTLMAFLAAYAPFSDSLFESLITLVELQVVKPLWDRATPILTESPEFDSQKTKLSSINGAVRFEHVSFRYFPEAPLVLKDVSFEVKPGEFIGIVGLSGAGKSTLLRLITGLDSPEKGEIYIDNHSLKNLDLQDFRRQISTVLQQSFILSGSIREFLSSGRNYSDARLLHALHEAGFTDDLKTLPMGLNTLLVNGAGTFSGGQRQRLILAKALVPNPKILLLDEATSALDNQTQEFVKKNLARQQITRIVVAHRLSTVRMADRIYVLDEGVIADQGTFDELSARLGLFANLLAKQKG